MKNKQLLALVTLSFASVANGQPGSFFDFGLDKPGVTLTNKASDDEDICKRGKLIVPAIQKALTNYLEALGPSTPANKLKKTIGPFQTQYGLRVLTDISIRVVILNKDDPLKFASTWRLPTFGGSGSSFLIHIPYKFMKVDGEPLRFEHLAMHEVGHIVSGTVGSVNDETDEIEKERRVEYQTYAVVGKEKYFSFIRAWLRGEYPGSSDEKIESSLSTFLTAFNISYGDEK